MWASVTLSRRFDIILASTSARRRACLDRGLPLLKYRCESPHFDETVDKTKCKTPGDYAVATARGKAIEVWSRLTKGGEKSRPLLVVAADTIIVTRDGTILEKPSSASHAISMISEISGTKCFAITGMCLVFDTEKDKQARPVTKCFFETTSLFVSNLDEATIKAYVGAANPRDKSGGLAYQDIGASLFRKIDGCYYNVVGLPLNRLCRELFALSRDVVEAE